MPWYKAGTVSASQNSNAIIGTGTAFIANARVGDGFRGPDGNWYEVTNIASDTSMSISPNYQGATNAAGSYALAPLQGYVKDSADALRTLVNTYGAKLAVLGTTGNYDILPIAKGGTGADSKSAAQAALGLVPQASPADATAGRLLLTGGAGLGGPLISSGTNANTLTSFGFYYLNAASNVPSNGWLQVRPVSANYCAQDFISESTGIRYTRTLIAGAWSQWAACYSNSNIVGTVSQAAGVSTGAVIETATNANGTYTKYADGTMMVRGRATMPAGAIYNQLGIYAPLAASFVNNLYDVSWVPFFSNGGGSQDACGTLMANGIFMGFTTSSIQFSCYTYRYPQTASCIFMFIAYGRWY
jgi:hypothetical protein